MLHPIARKKLIGMGVIVLVVICALAFVKVMISNMFSAI